MKNVYKILGVIIALVSITSCRDKSKRNHEFFPNMYYSVGYETYSDSEGFSASQLPVEGTIKRGWTPFEYENSPEGKELAKVNLLNPLAATDENLAKGKELYNIYCSVCHGTKGKGDGKLVKNEKFLGVPNYADRDITEGSIYHVVYYGLNSMGSHAGQINEKERWQVAMYVKQLRADLKK